MVPYYFASIVIAMMGKMGLHRKIYIPAIHLTLVNMLKSNENFFS